MPPRTIVLPVKCSTVKRWNSKLPDIMLAESIIYSLVSGVFLIVEWPTETSHILPTSFNIALLSLAAVGLLWGMLLLYCTITVCADNINAFGDACVKWVSTMYNKLKEVIPRLECIKDEPEEP